MMKTPKFKCRLIFATLCLLIFGGGVPTVSAESALLAKVKAGGDVKVVLLGTSLTAGGAWPASLQSWLAAEAPKNSKVRVVNRASSGQASDHGLKVQLPAALLDKPDVVFIEFSMNDAATTKKITLKQSKDNLNAIIDKLEAQNPDVIVVLQTMNNIAADTSPFSPRPKLDSYYQIYREVAKERGTILIDHYKNWQKIFTTNKATWKTYMKDAVHPNPLGQKSVLMIELKKNL